MTVKELYKKYKEYHIELFGRPLNEETIPFSFLPIDKKKLDKMTVKELQVEKVNFTNTCYSLDGLKYQLTEEYKGIVKAYCVEEANINA